MNSETQSAGVGRYKNPTLETLISANMLNSHFRTTVATNTILLNRRLFPAKGRRSVKPMDILSLQRLQTAALPWLRHPRTMEYEAKQLLWYHSKVVNAIRIAHFVKHYKIRSIAGVSKLVISSRLWPGIICATSCLTAQTLLSGRMLFAAWSHLQC